MKKGWFSLHKCIFANGVWKDPVQFRLFIFLVGNAVYQKDKVIDYGIVKVKYGQFLRSYRKLQDDLSYLENRQIKRYSLSTIKRTVDKLVRLQRIAKLETQLGTLFTILNFDKYQVKQTKNETINGVETEQKRELGTELGTNAERPQNNTNKELIRLIIELAKSLIKSINKESSFYSITNKYLKLLGKDKLLKILSDSNLKGNSFENENRLAAYLEACRRSNGHNNKLKLEFNPIGAEDDK